jgi:hypothetical protein
MDRVKTRKGARYTVTAALMLASAPLILALPATGAPCDPVGGIVPALICPPSPDRPKPKETPVPTASATVVPASPKAPTGRAPAPRPPAVPVPTGAQAPAPTAAPGAQAPAENPPTISTPADGSTATTPRPRRPRRRRRVPWPRRHRPPGTLMAGASPVHSCWHSVACWSSRGFSWTSGRPPNSNPKAPGPCPAALRPRTLGNEPAPPKPFSPRAGRPVCT